MTRSIALVALAVGVACLLVGGAIGWALTRGGSGTGTVRADSTDGAARSTTTAGSGGHDMSDMQPDAATVRPDIVDFAGSERAALAAQLVQVRAVALRYPTLADAAAAGYEPTTPYAPGTGAHMGRDDQTQSPGEALDLTRPQSYLYDGTEPDSRVVGVMYVQLGGDTAPDGFVGPLDTWSAQRGQCLAADAFDPLFPAADSVTEQQCTDAGGRFLDITAWTQHVWVVPGWEAPGGVFAMANADIVCADGTTDADPVAGCPAPASTRN